MNSLLARVVVGGVAVGAVVTAAVGTAVSVYGQARASRVSQAGPTLTQGSVSLATVRYNDLPAEHAGWQAKTGGAAAAHPVVLVGIPGLRWSDVSASATPALWRLAGAGSVGSLVVHSVSTVTCPGDGWLTLNAGTRATLHHTTPGQCPALPAVSQDRPASAGAGLHRANRHPTPAPASVPRMADLVNYNQQFHYNPDWGLLASAAGPGGCSTAIGPGAALALASPQGKVAGYLPTVADATKATFARCPLTVVDLGALNASSGRAAAIKADDAELGRISADLPAGAILVIAAPGDDLSPHLRLLVVDGPGYADGLLHTASTRQPGLTQLTDVTASVLQWRGRPVPSQALGSPLTRGARPGLAAEVRALTAQDTAAQVYKATFGWFFAIFAVGETVLFGLIAFLLRGRGDERRRRRRAACRVTGLVAGSVPAGTFLASLVSWWALPHPAVLLYVLAAAWTVIIAAIALAGPWRRDPLGPPGVIGAITVLVVGIDVMTGSRLELNTPFGLSVLWGGRFYGEDNNTVGIYAAATVFCAVWLAALLLRRAGADRAGADGVTAERRDRGKAVLAVAVISLFAVVASGWPGFGAKVGGTIAMVPSLLVLITAVAGVRITWRRAIVIAVSGVLVIAAFALVNYFVPITGHSDVGNFAGQAIHGQGGGTLQRKISTNLSSLTTTPYSVIIPIAVAALGVLLLRPAWFAAGSLTEARRTVPLLSVALAAIWVMAVLGWFAEDSGVAVPASMLPFVLPLAIAIVSSAPRPADGISPGQAEGSDQDVPSRLSQAAG